MEEFAHPVRTACGYYAARVLLSQAQYTRYPVPPSNSFLGALHPVLPGKLMNMLNKYGAAAAKYTFPSSRPARIWLREQMKYSRAVALFVPDKPMHWIVALGLDDAGSYLIYDPRVGKTSRDLALPVGNTTMSEAQMQAEWVHAYWFRFVAVSIA